MVQGVIVSEKKYINQEVPQVTVSFQLSVPDWNLLRATHSVGMGSTTNSGKSKKI